MHRKEHARKTIKPLLEAAHAGIETGNIDFVCYNYINYCNHLFLTGEMLETVEQKYLQFTDYIVNFKQAYSIWYIKISRQITLNLRGKSVDKCHLVSDDLNEAEFIPVWIKANSVNLLFIA